MKRTLLIILIFSAFLNLKAQTPEKKSYQTKFTATEPVIDGLPDKCWNDVSWEGGFIQIHPAENKPPSQQTDFKFLYDNNNLYVLIRAHDTEAGKISRIISRRDNFSGDRVELQLDSYFDGQTAFSFTATASGTKGDAVISQNGNNWDSNWNPVWFLGTSIDDSGWTAEMKIPLSQLRFGKKEEQVWGIQITRHIYRSEERSSWQYIPKGSPGMILQFGELNGIRKLKPKRQIELMPYLVAGTERFEKEEGNPYLDGKTNHFSGGLDGKIGVTNDLTLDFTINPDFGQVEADPSEVNLTAFETYFSEKRPFFIEGSNIFQFKPNQSIVINNMYSDELFYSRRIGRSPQYYPSLAANEYADMPQSTTILGAAKLSGKTRNGLSIGILESITSEEKATIYNEGVTRKETVEPYTSYFTGRLQKDFKKGKTTIGGIITSVNRNINSRQLDFLPTDAVTGGLDANHYWNGRTWYVSGNAEFSTVKGAPESILLLQTSSARYFQRPDARYLAVDSSRTSLSGIGGTVKLGRGSQKKLQFETSLTMRSPGLEFNDIGYMRYSDVIHHGSWLAYYIRNPFAIFNNFYLNTNYWIYLDYSGNVLSLLTNTNFNTQFKNRWRMNGQLTRQSENRSNTLLRGGPSFLFPGETELSMNLRTDQSKKVAFYAGNYHNLGDDNSQRMHVYWAGAEVKPLNSLSVSLSPEYFIKNTAMQFISTLSYNETTRYLFGELDQKTLSMTFRINLTINPELTLEYYGQPFISAGKYSSYKMVTDPSADKFSDRYALYTDNQIAFSDEDSRFYIDEDRNGMIDYSFGNPDFNFRQFRSNLVVRWEYLPGSTLYLVWSQGRTGSSSTGHYSFSNDMRELFDVVPKNVFLVKFSYLFML